VDAAEFARSMMYTNGVQGNLKDVYNSLRSVDNKPDSARCPSCKAKEDSVHIDAATNPGKFGELREKKETDQTSKKQ